MATLMRDWRRRAHRTVLQRLRSPGADGSGPTGTSAPRMPFLSAVYGLIVVSRRTRALASAQRISPPHVPVISVGNFTFGATGKTPCVMLLADFILGVTSRNEAQADRVPMLLTRGYGDDEWRMFATRFPTCKLAVGSDRLALGTQEAARHGSGLSCVLLEDGLQQWAIHKDLEIVMIDALAPFGNGKLIPHGSLRELPVDALARADVVLLHHANQISDEKQLSDLTKTVRDLTLPQRKAVVGTSEMRVVALPTLDEFAQTTNPGTLPSTTEWHRFKGKTALIFCGVGNPGSVELVVRAMRCWASVAIESFPDHHAFTADDLEDVRMRAEAIRFASDITETDDLIFLTTEKDYARSASLIRREFADLPVRVIVGGFQLGMEKESVLNRVKNLLQ